MPQYCHRGVVGHVQSFFAYAQHQVVVRDPLKIVPVNPNQNDIRIQH